MNGRTLDLVMIEHDSDGSIKQQIIAVLMGVAAVLSAYAARLRAKIKGQSYSNEYLQNLVKDSVNRTLVESEHFRSIDRRMESLERGRLEDRNEVTNSIDRLTRQVQTLSQRTS